jgi:hypothetical protein
MSDIKSAAPTIEDRLKTIRSWFFIAAALGAWFDVRPMLQADLPTEVSVLMLIRITLLIGYLMVAIRVEHFLRFAPIVPKGIVIGNVMYKIAVAAWLASQEGEFPGKYVFAVAVSLVLNFILWSFVTTTSRDLRAEKVATTESANETADSK